VVQDELCPSCSLPVVPGQAFCASCGARLAAKPVPEAAAPHVAELPINEETGVAPEIDPRLAALGFDSDATLPELAPEPELALEPPPEPAPARVPERETVPWAAAQSWPAPDPVPTAEPWSPLPIAAPPPSRTIQPSSSFAAGARVGDSPLRSVGAQPIAPPVVAAPRATTAPSIPFSVAGPAPQAERDASSQLGLSGVLHMTVPELIVKGLVITGGVVGLLSLFLAWAGHTGNGVGTTVASPPNGWSFNTPAGIYMLIISVLLVGSAVAPAVVPFLGYPEADRFIRRFKRIIVTVTDLIVPLVVGGLYLGVALLYWSLPWGYGTGIFILVLGAILLIAGATTALYFGPTLYEDPAE